MLKPVNTSSIPLGHTLADRPLVSVLMPAYGHTAYIKAAIQSVWSQTYRSIELIVVDDCSPDGTFEMAQSLVAQSPIPMKVAQNSSNQGISGTLNHALSLAKGELISILASDDWYDDHKTADQVSVLLTDKTLGCVHSNSFLITPDDQVIGEVYGVGILPPLEGDCFLDLAYGRGNLVAITAMFWRDMIDEFDADLMAEDFDLHLRLSKQKPYAFITTPLTYSRVVPGSLGKRPDKYIDELFSVLHKHQTDLGDDYDSVVMTRALHAVNICAAHNHWFGVQNAIELGVEHARDPAEVMSFLAKASTVSISMFGRDLIAHRIPKPMRESLSKSYQNWLFRSR
jgi:glycosyltransferase involved in cell wall biosynthesis